MTRVSGVCLVQPGRTFIHVAVRSMAKHTARVQLNVRHLHIHALPLPRLLRPRLRPQQHRPQLLPSCPR